MLCRKEEKDPRKCIEEGKMVTSCALEFFRKVKKACPQELKDYAHCLDKSSTDMNPKQSVQPIAYLLCISWISNKKMALFQRPLVMMYFEKNGVPGFLSALLFNSAWNMQLAVLYNCLEIHPLELCVVFY